MIHSGCTVSVYSCRYSALGSELFLFLGSNHATPNQLAGVTRYSRLRSGRGTTLFHVGLADPLLNSEFQEFPFQSPRGS